MTHAALLGAGFSKAISDHMPLTDALGADVLSRLAGSIPPARDYLGSGFEAWLSRLAEPQPDLTTSDNLANRSLFLRISELLRDAVVDVELSVLADPLPWWLQRLVGTWHFSGTSAVITFNYDLLVEHALVAASLFDQNNVRITADAALRYGPQLPYVPPEGISAGSRRGKTFQLLKLHGSTDSFWVADDASGVSINRWPSSAAWNRPIKASEDERRQRLPDRVPFVVPPAAAKSPFYRNPVTRELWQQAGQAIEEADEVALVGYSLPMTDLVTAGMLGERLRGTSSKVIVCNPFPDDVVSALKTMKIDESRIETLSGPGNACELYTDRLERQLQPGWSDVGIDGTMPLGAGATPTATFDIVRIVDVDADHTVVLEAVPRSGAPASTVSIESVLTAAGSAAPKARLRWPDGSESYVARGEASRGPSGAPESLTLIPTAIPSRPVSGA